MVLIDALKQDRLLSDYSDEQISVFSDLRGINTRQVLNTSSLRDFELLKADMIADILLSPDFTEGKLSLKYDRYILNDYIQKIAEKYQDEKLQAATQGVSGGIENITEEW